MSESNICADCDYFALESGKRRSGACLAKWYPKVIVGDSRIYGAYGRVLSFDDACDRFVPAGTFKREPERGGR